MKIWVVDMDSRSFDWFVAGQTAEEAENAFKRAWHHWCCETGADPYYWGEKGDQWSEVTAVEREIGTVYQDGSPF